MTNKQNLSDVTFLILVRLVSNNWGASGMLDMDGCPACGYGELAEPAPGDPGTGAHFGQLLNHIVNHKKYYYE